MDEQIHVVDQETLDRYKMILAAGQLCSQRPKDQALADAHHELIRAAIASGHFKPLALHAAFEAEAYVTQQFGTWLGAAKQVFAGAPRPAADVAEQVLKTFDGKGYHKALDYIESEPEAAEQLLMALMAMAVRANDHGLTPVTYDATAQSARHEPQILPARKMDVPIGGDAGAVAAQHVANLVDLTTPGQFSGKEFTNYCGLVYRSGAEILGRTLAEAAALADVGTRKAGVTWATHSATYTYDDFTPAEKQAMQAILACLHEGDLEAAAGMLTRVASLADEPDDDNDGLPLVTGLLGAFAGIIAASKARTVADTQKAAEEHLANLVRMSADWLTYADDERRAMEASGVFADYINSLIATGQITDVALLAAREANAHLIETGVTWEKRFPKFVSLANYSESDVRQIQGVLKLSDLRMIKEAERKIRMVCAKHPGAVQGLISLWAGTLVNASERTVVVAEPLSEGDKLVAQLRGYLEAAQHDLYEDRVNTLYERRALGDALAAAIKQADQALKAVGQSWAGQSMVLLSRADRRRINLEGSERDATEMLSLLGRAATDAVTLRTVQARANDLAVSDRDGTKAMLSACLAILTKYMPSHGAQDRIGAQAKANVDALIAACIEDFDHRGSDVEQGRPLGRFWEVVIRLYRDGTLISALTLALLEADEVLARTRRTWTQTMTDFVAMRAGLPEASGRRVDRLCRMLDQRLASGISHHDSDTISAELSQLCDPVTGDELAAGCLATIAVCALAEYRTTNQAVTDAAKKLPAWNPDPKLLPAWRRKMLTDATEDVTIHGLSAALSSGLFSACPDPYKGDGPTGEVRIGMDEVARFLAQQHATTLAHARLYLLDEEMMALCERKAARPKKTPITHDRLLTGAGLVVFPKPVIMATADQPDAKPIYAVSWDRWDPDSWPSGYWLIKQAALHGKPSAGGDLDVVSVPASYWKNADPQHPNKRIWWFTLYTSPSIPELAKRVPLAWESEMTVVEGAVFDEEIDQGTNEYPVRIAIAMHELITQTELLNKTVTKTTEYKQRPKDQRAEQRRGLVKDSGRVRVISIGGDGTGKTVTGPKKPTRTGATWTLNKRVFVHEHERNQCPNPHRHQEKEAAGGCEHHEITILDHWRGPDGAPLSIPNTVHHVHPPKEQQ